MLTVALLLVRLVPRFPSRIHVPVYSHPSVRLCHVVGACVRVFVVVIVVVVCVRACVHVCVRACVCARAWRACLCVRARVLAYTA